MGSGNDTLYPSGGDLSPFFEPESVAIIGSFREGFFGGHVVIKSLLNAGFSGQIYPVNPAYKEVLGLTVYPSIREVHKKVDLAIIMINAQAVPAVIEDCGEKGVGAVIVVSDGFAERNKQGARLQEEIVTIARQRGVRIVGPNTAGIVNTSSGLNPCPYDAGYYKLRKGSIAICAQTGMINPQAFPYPRMHVGISKICDFGNKCDVNECDMLEYLEADASTTVISMYLESIADGRRFLEISNGVTKEKPVLILKSGKTRESARASASHTGSMAVDDRTFEAVCRQAGMLRLEEFDEVFEIPKLFATQPLPAGNRLGMLSITGAIGVLTADEAARYGLVLANLTPKTAAKLNGIFPGLGNVPVDIGPMSVVVRDLPDQYPQILSAVTSDENVDAVLNVLWADPGRYMKAMYLEAYEQLKTRYPKPVATWIYGPDTSMIAELAEPLENLGFPVFSNLKISIKALGLACKYSKIRKGRLC